MIKCEVEICAKITRAAVVKNTADGGTFVSFGVTIPIEGRNHAKKELEIGVTIDGGKAEKAAYTSGRRVRVYGIMTIRKKGGKIYYNLRGDGGCEFTKSTDPDIIEGNIEFRGKIGKQGVDERKDKKGKPFKSFSAFSSDKEGDTTEFTWARFLYFNCKEGEEFLQANSYVEVKGQLQLGVFRDEISIDCRVEEVRPWEIKKNS